VIKMGRRELIPEIKAAQTLSDLKKVLAKVVADSLVYDVANGEFKPDVEDDHIAPEFDPSEKFHRAYWAKVVSFTAGATKPLKIGRIYKGVETQIDCYVTERIRELYQAGRLAADDYVLVQFVDGDSDKPIAIEKAYKSW